MYHVDELTRDGRPAAAVDEAIQRSQDYFLRTQHADGYWWGELESNVCMAAESTCC